MKGKPASAGWYNSVAFEQAAHKAGLYAKSINGDAFSNEIKAGSSLLHTGITLGHRSANLHPVGTLMGDGMSPWIVVEARDLSMFGSACGLDAISVWE